MAWLGFARAEGEGGVPRECRGYSLALAELSGLCFQRDSDGLGAGGDADMGERGLDSRVPSEGRPKTAVMLMNKANGLPAAEEAFQGRDGTGRQTEEAGKRPAM